MSASLGSSQLTNRSRHPAWLATAAAFSLLLTVALLAILVGGYVLHWSWTGYLGKHHHPRQLWDWLTLLVQPLTLLLLPLWLRSHDQRSGVWKLAAVGAALAMGVLVLGGYLLNWTWTGFSDNTLWDWLGLFLVPFLLPVVLLFIVNLQSHERVREPSNALGFAGDGGFVTTGDSAPPQRDSLTFECMCVTCARSRADNRGLVSPPHHRIDEHAGPLQP
jgi:hypothetical protein